MSKGLQIKISLLAMFFSALSFNGFSQTTIWSDDFNNGCSANCLADSWNGWSVLDNDGGLTGGAPNNWFISCAEEGITPPGCGSSCIGDASLHIGANPGAGGDQGASFNETGATNATFRTAISPIISTVGFSTVSLTFDFIAYGSASCSDDRLELRLSTDGGATWPVGYNTCLTSVCCGACNGYSQGQWTTYTLALPMAFYNNPNVRIGFNWRNNGNGSGTDPSAAIDDIRLTSPIVLPVNVLNFSAIKESNKVKVSWVTSAERLMKAYEIERAGESLVFKKIGTVSPKGNNSGASQYYTFADAGSIPGTIYYRLKMIDNDGKFTYSKIAKVTAPGPKEDLSVLSTDAGKGKLRFSVWAGYDMPAAVYLYDMQGKKVAEMSGTFFKTGMNEINFKTLPSLAGGYYILKIASLKVGQLSLLNTTRKFLYSEN